MSAAPPKFIKENNIRRLNPQYKTWLEVQKKWMDDNASANANVANLDALLGGNDDGEVASSSNPNLHVVSLSGGMKSKGWTPPSKQQQQPQQTSSVNSAVLPDGTIRSVAPASSHQKFALPVISSVAEHKKYLSDTPLSANVEQTKQALEKDEVAKRLGVPKSQIMNNLSYAFAKFEIPLGILEKLIDLENWDHIIYLVDDSSSMNMDTDARHPVTRQIMTRWEECELRIKNMIEVLAYVPSPPITIIFLNRTEEVTFEHKPGEPPYAFIGRSFAKIRTLFYTRARGCTPMLESIKRSMDMFPGERTLRYVLADGVPTGGRQEIYNITQLLIKRPNPQNSPFTFLSCTNEDEQVLWMKECEERAPFCAELDDFMDESNEVHKDQGKAFNFSYGFWLVCCIVAAINPHDLDALDESAPLSKKTLDRLQGYVCTKEEYNYYFEEFLKAQIHRPIETSLDRLKKSYLDTWRNNKQAFFEAEKAGDIPVVEEFRLRIRGRLNGVCCAIQ